MDWTFLSARALASSMIGALAGTVAAFCLTDESAGILLLSSAGATVGSVVGWTTCQAARLKPIVPQGPSKS